MLKNILLNILLFVIFGLTLVSKIFEMNPRLISGTDFSMFYTGARILSSNLREEIYNTEVQTLFRNEVVGLEKSVTNAFRSPPPIALLFIPFSFFTLEIAYKAYALLNLGLLFGVFYFLQRESPSVKNKSFFILLMFSFLPGIASVVSGQISIALLILFIYIFRFLKSKPFWSGMLVSLIFNKPQYLLFVPFALILSMRRKLFLKGFFLGLFGLLLISIALVGSHSSFRYPSFVVSTETFEYGVIPDKLVTLSSFFYWLGLSNYYVYFFVSIAFLLVLTFFLKKYKSAPYEMAFSSALLFAFALSIHTWIHDLFILLLPIVILLKNFMAKRRISYLLVLLILFVAPFMQYTKYPFLVSFVLIGIGFWFLSQRRKLQDYLE